MKDKDLENYQMIRSGGKGFYPQQRGLIEVWGKESVQFLDGLISNDVKTLADGAQMAAAFPNAQGRLLAMIRVMRQGDKFLIETEGATREKIFQNLFRFTFAGDFFAENVSDKFSAFSIFGNGVDTPTGSLSFGNCIFVPLERANEYRDSLTASGAVEVSDDLYEVLRIEGGIPKYGVDMDETTIVPEVGNTDAISYTKGCYIGQEIIARIHFRGHVAKQLTGLILEDGIGTAPGDELLSTEGKNAGRITSVCFSPEMDRFVALAYVRYEFLADGTELAVGGKKASVKTPPFIAR